MSENSIDYYHEKFQKHYYLNHSLGGVDSNLVEDYLNLIELTEGITRKYFNDEIMKKYAWLQMASEESTLTFWNQYDNGLF